MRLRLVPRCRRVIDLLGVEHAEGAGDETAVAVLAIVGPARRVAVEHHTRTALALADLRAEFGPLPVSRSTGIGKAGRLTATPERYDVDAAIGPACQSDRW